MLRESNNQQATKEIANTILSQLGGRKFLAMTGAKLAYEALENDSVSLHIKLPKMAKSNINLVKVIYNHGTDLYSMKFLSMKRDYTITEKKLIDVVYCDDLIPFFEQNTGLYCYL